MLMVSVAIVEDDPGYTKRLREYLKKYEEEYREPLQVTAYSDGDGRKYGHGSVLSVSSEEYCGKF